MNNPKQSVEKIEELLKAARETNGLFAHAAAFAAITALVDKLDRYFKEKAVDADENVERLRSHSAAMLGYDITNGHSIKQHYVWALDAISGLNDALSRLRN